MARVKNKKEDVNTEEIIFNTAYNLLAQKGYANVSTREIALEAGVALSQLNYYFKSKENLFLKIIALAVDKIVSELKEVFAKGTSRRENFVLMIEYFKQKIRNDPDLMKLLLDFTVQAMWVKRIRICVYGLFRELNLLVQKYIIKDDIKQKMFKGVPVDYVAEIAVYGVLGMTLHVILGKTDVSEIKTETLTKILFDEDTPVPESVEGSIY